MQSAPKLLSKSEQANFERAARKVKRTYKRTWSGYLTPSEILALIKAGVRPNDTWNLDYIKKCKDRGDSSPHTFRFTLGKVILPE